MNNYQIVFNCENESIRKQLEELIEDVLGISTDGIHEIHNDNYGWVDAEYCSLQKHTVNVGYYAN